MSDVLGRALMDHFEGRRSQKLWVHDEHGPNMEMPVKTYFRDEKSMSALERKALQMCKGRVLDIGAGAGSHALALQEKGLDVTAMDISPKAVEVMKRRGVKNAVQQDIFKFKGERFDTLLLMMNGIGLSGTINGLKRFLKHVKSILNTGGQLVFDSSDLMYLIEDELLTLKHYYGEIKCRYEYEKQFSEWLTWLFIDRNLLREIALKEGWRTAIIFEGASEQYLAQLTLT